MRAFKAISAGLLFFFSLQVYAQGTRASAICAEVAKISNPPSDLPPAGTNVPEYCDAWGEYYGEGEPQNFQEARYCAYSHLPGNDSIGNDSMEGNVEAPAVLAMIYAGGKGVVPNLRLAIKFACEIVGAWDDNAALVEMLETKEKQGDTRVDLDVCDNPTGRQMNYQCLMRDQGRAANEADEVERRFESTGDNAQQAAFEQILIARTGFLYAHEAEKPSGGTVGRVQACIGEDLDVQQAWAKTLNDLASGKLPHYTEEQFKKADADLNDEYADARQNDSDCATQPCGSSIRDTERAWLAYREAWVKYGKLRWPSISADSWRTMLTVERTEMLRAFD